MNINIEYSNLENPIEAGKEIIRKIKEKQEPKIGLLFSTINYNNDELLSTIRKENTNFDVIGCTTSAGLITQEGYKIDENGVASMMTIGGKDLEIACYALDKKNTARETGRKVAIKALEKAKMDYAPDYFYMTSTPNEEEEYMKGIQDVIGRVPCFGGSAADNTNEKNWNIFYNDKIIKEGVAVIFFYTEKNIITKFISPYKETENVGIITKLKDNKTIEKINNKNALDIYSKWLNKELNKDNILIESINKPLGIKDKLGDVINIIHPLNIDKDGFIELSSKVSENTALIEMTSTTKELEEKIISSIKELKKETKNPSGYLLIINGCIRLKLGEKMSDIYDEIKKELGNIPFLVEFSFGEYGYTDNQSNLNSNLTLSLTSFEN